MPLVQGKSPKAFTKNLKAELHAGKPKDQALAIAYSVQRKNKAKKMAEGGEVTNEKLHPHHEPMHPMKNIAKEIMAKKMAMGGEVMHSDAEEFPSEDTDFLADDMDHEGMMESEDVPHELEEEEEMSILERIMKKIHNT